MSTVNEDKIAVFTCLEVTMSFTYPGVVMYITRACLITDAQTSIGPREHLQKVYRL